MDSVTLFITLLVAVAIGWWLGYRSGSGRISAARPDWIPSVNDVLSDSSGRSVQQLLDVVPDDSLDLLKRIGRSLRDKGEVDKAIQFHQALFARTDLNKAVLHELELELALDYFHAGLNDRSENLLLNLIKYKTTVGLEALKVLVRLYEEEGEWQKIVALSANRKMVSGTALRRAFSHAACELAVSSMDFGNYLEARKHCRLALKIDPECARALVVQGDMAFKNEEPREAIRCYLKAINVDSNCLIVLLPSLTLAFRQVGDDQGLYTHLKDNTQALDYIPALIAMAEAQIPLVGFEAALDGYLSHLSSKPSHSGFVACIGLLAKNSSQLSQSQLDTAYDILQSLDEYEPRFFCDHCGFEGRQFQWRCPSCNEWSTLMPYTSKASLPLHNKEL